MAITIDGSYGEGGGQVLRTALSLSALLEKNIEIERITDQGWKAETGFAATAFGRG
jgi:RNA 3'-terminal phosphate cyclase